MDAPALVVCLLNFVTIALLPQIFFRRDGQRNLHWWLTALPFNVYSLLLVAGALGWIDPMAPRGWATGLAVAAVIASTAATALVFFTLGTHRVRIALWHQDNDAPQSIVTNGAYRLVRHPFYTSFLLASIGATLLLPHWATAATLLYTVLRLNATAAKEERKLSASEFGAEYQAYVGRTGRFAPRLLSSRPAAVSS
jgi:protein-S-isoprenylcysteine O-methyltransferase Ste14